MIFIIDDEEKMTNKYDEDFEEYKADNLDNLRSMFIESEYLDKFHEFCKEQYKKDKKPEQKDTDTELAIIFGTDFDFFENELKELLDLSRDKEYNKDELVFSIIGIFEDFLDSKNVKIENEERKIW